MYSRRGRFGVVPGAGFGVLTLTTFQWIAVIALVAVTYAVIMISGG